MNRFTKTMAIAASSVCLISLIGCVMDAPFKFQNGTTPEQLDDGWQVALPENVNISQQALDRVYDAFISEDQYYNAKSLLVVKNGKLVFETYCRTPDDRDRMGHVQSVTKSITSLIVGIVRSEGHIDSLDRTLFSIMPDKFSADTAKHSITLRHLLTMTSGLSFDNDVFSVEIHTDRPADPVRHILGKPLYAHPGERFYYRDCDPHLVGHAVQLLTGRSIERWAEERLFEPLDIRAFHWDSDPTGTPTGAYGLHLKPRDLAKIGQMVLDGGCWTGRRIVDPAWIALSTQRHTATDHDTEPDIWDYGFYWWSVPRWQAFAAWGQGGNFVFVVPERKLVVVMTSMPDVDDETVGTQLDDFEELIRPILEEG